jgi:CheY-like chemotaxis protein
MNVLLADDSSTIRAVLKRFLTRKFDCTITEAQNGLEVLKALDGAEFSLVLMDVHMPVMDGLETLEILRDSTHGDVPVVLLTSDRGEALFKQAVALGIDDYLTKPLLEDTMAERLGKVLGSIDADSSESCAQEVEDPGSHADVTILVAEGDPEHQRFLLDFFGSRCRVLSATSGVEALETCLSAAPQMVFVGGDLGIINAATLARKIRNIGDLADTRVVATVSRTELSEARAAGVYDTVVARSFVPDIFEDEFAQLRAAGSAGIGARASASAVSAESGHRQRAEARRAKRAMERS